MILRSALILVGLNLNGSFAASSLETELGRHRFEDFEGTCGVGVNAYKNTGYSFVREKCVRCHGGDGPGNPAFADDNMNESYFHVRNRVNFTDPLRSLLVIKGTDGHCRGCGATAEGMAKMLQNWWEQGEKTCVSNGKLFSGKIPVPADLPRDRTKFMTLAWDLGSIRNEFRGVQFLIDAQKYADPDGGRPGAYLFRKPRMMGGNVAFRIKDVKVLVNGRFDIAADAFRMIDTTVAPQNGSRTAGEAAPYPLLTAETLIVLQDQKEGDQLSLSFEILEKGTVPMCRRQAQFEADVLSLMKARSCTYCHGGADEGGFEPANRSFNMNLSDADLCSAMLQRTVREVIALSPIVKLPLGQAPEDHPEVVGLDEVDPAWLNWIKAEIRE